jgi:hypothetical protein
MSCHEDRTDFRVLLRRHEARLFKPPAAVHHLRQIGRELEQILDERVNRAAVLIDPIAHLVQRLGEGGHSPFAGIADERAADSLLHVVPGVRDRVNAALERACVLLREAGELVAQRLHGVGALSDDDTVPLEHAGLAGHDLADEGRRVLNIHLLRGRNVGREREVLEAAGVIAGDVHQVGECARGVVVRVARRLLHLREQLVELTLRAGERDADVRYRLLHAPPGRVGRGGALDRGLRERRDD